MKTKVADERGDAVRGKAATPAATSRRRFTRRSVTLLASQGLLLARLARLLGDLGLMLHLLGDSLLKFWAHHGIHARLGTPQEEGHLLRGRAVCCLLLTQLVLHVARHSTVVILHQLRLASHVLRPGQGLASRADPHRRPWRVRATTTCATRCPNQTRRASSGRSTTEIHGRSRA